MISTLPGFTAAPIAPKSGIAPQELVATVNFGLALGDAEAGGGEGGTSQFGPNSKPDFGPELGQSLAQSAAPNTTAFAQMRPSQSGNPFPLSGTHLPSGPTQGGVFDGLDPIDDGVVEQSGPQVSNAQTNASLVTALPREEGSESGLDRAAAGLEQLVQTTLAKPSVPLSAPSDAEERGGQDAGRDLVPNVSPKDAQVLGENPALLQAISLEAKLESGAISQPAPLSQSEAEGLTQTDLRSLGNPRQPTAQPLTPSPIGPPSGLGLSGSDLSQALGKGALLATPVAAPVSSSATAVSSDVEAGVTQPAPARAPVPDPALVSAKGTLGPQTSQTAMRAPVDPSNTLQASITQSTISQAKTTEASTTETKTTETSTTRANTVQGTPPPVANLDPEAATSSAAQTPAPATVAAATQLTATRLPMHETARTQPSPTSEPTERALGETVLEVSRLSAAPTAQVAGLRANAPPAEPDLAPLSHSTAQNAAPSPAQQSLQASMESPASQPTGAQASNPQVQAVNAPAAPQPSIQAPILDANASARLAAQLESTIEQLTETRSAAQASRPEMTVRHQEFGAITMRLETLGNDLRATLSARDPGFVPAIQTALSERAVVASSETSSSAGQRGSDQGSSQSSSQSNSQGNNSQGQSHAGSHGQGWHSDPRYGSSTGSGQGTSQPYTGQTGNRDENLGSDPGGTNRFGDGQAGDGERFA